MKRITFFFIFGLIINTIPAQESHLIAATNIFSKDSLVGFEEEITKQVAFNEGFIGEELKVYLERSKRNFINIKYNIHSSQINESQNQLSLPSTTTCFNEDFESTLVGTITMSNQVTGWTLDSGTNGGTSAGNCSVTVCCANPPNAVQILSNGYIETSIGGGYPIYSVFGSSTNPGNSIPLNSSLAGQMYGSKFIRLNDNTPNFGIHRLSKYITVTPSNAIFKYAFISVNSSGHACCDADAFVIKATNLTTGSVLATPNYSFSGGSIVCANTSTITYYTPNTYTITTMGSMFNPWHVDSVDLSPYIGNNIRIDFISYDCTGGSHSSVSFIDAECKPSTVTGITSYANHYYFKVYPNPVYDNFKIDISNEIMNGEIELKNILGQTVLKQSVKQGSNIIRIENLAKGIYNYSVLQSKEVLSAGKLVVE